MRNLHILLFTAALSLGACHSNHVSSPRPEYGSLTAPEAPPAPLEVEAPEKEGHVWVAGRWAWMNDQWMWQPGYHEPARAGMHYAGGYWDRKKGTWTWIEASWKQERWGYDFVPGKWEQRGETHVWIRDRWVKEGEGDFQATAEKAR